VVKRKGQQNKKLEPYPILNEGFEEIKKRWYIILMTLGECRRRNPVFVKSIRGGGKVIFKEPEDLSKEVPTQKLIRKKGRLLNH